MLRCKICGKPHYEANPRSTAAIKGGQPCEECEAKLAMMSGKREKNIEALKEAFGTLSEKVRKRLKRTRPKKGKGKKR